MAYRYDDDLEFLGSCKDEDLEILVNHLTKDKELYQMNKCPL